MPDGLQGSAERSSFAGVRRIIRICLWLVAVLPVSAKELDPHSVAVLYNSAVPESKQLADTFREARNIPEGNLIGLEMPVAQEISREDYITKIQNPLRAEFDKRSWWSRGKDASGVLLPTSNDMRVLVLMKGVPLKIQPAPLPEGFKVPENDPIAGRNEASVDSELAMFGAEGLPIQGVLKNAFFGSEKPISESAFPFLILTSRIDGASFATCERMIQDALEVEKTGLWGMAYVDIANKFPQGDEWLNAIVIENRNAGIPTVVDRFDDTLPMNYPMTDAALYYGWYDWNLSGPFLNPAFKFRKGAVAMHLHSFSADQLQDPMKNWSAGLLEKGAAATIGNVYEPYLGLTHYFEILHKRLLAGHTWVEACWMSIPVASWQGITLGDPFYRPFLHLDNTGKMAAGDNDFRALRAAAMKWPSDSATRQKQLMGAAVRMKSGIVSEAIALEAVEGGRMAEGALWFRNAEEHYQVPQDKLRQRLNLAAIERKEGRKDLAIRDLKAIGETYGSLPEATAAKGWLDILDPPAPPPATPKQ